MPETSAAESLRHSLSLLKQPTSEPSRSLASQLAVEMADRWQHGERPLAEEFLARHPDLRDQPDAALRVICEEICLRQEHNETLDPGAILARFPDCRDQIAVLLDCHRLLVPDLAEPAFPVVGESLGDFKLIAELGRGGQGCVFLARQPSLADRPVVVKVTPRTGQEHLSLARLQHTHIVPLYLAEDEPAKNLRILCMPYFGGTSLTQVLEALGDKPLGQRTGLDLLSAIDQAQLKLPIPIQRTGPARQMLARVSYAQAVAFLGACLADALQYAHERGLLHLDIKPSNVLLAADGQPMLLDFHLAHEPIRAAAPKITWFGGTPEYMSPEQAAACKAIPQGKPLARDVDARSDIYSLGLTLYESLAGTRLPPDTKAPPPLSRINPQVSVGLSDIITRCLRVDAKDRYPDAASLAADLRRHLTNQPLRGVKNRSWAERWRKWRQRKPHALTVVLLLSVVLAVLAAGGTLLLVQHGRRVDESRIALRDGIALNQARQYAEAARVLTAGLQVARNLPEQESLVRELDRQLNMARYGQLADNLHRLAEQVRFLYDAENLSRARMESLESACRAVHDARQTLLEGRKQLGDSSSEEVRTDFLDLVILWTALRVRLAEPDTDKARREALDILAEAEAMFGQSAALLRERASHAEALGLADMVRTSKEQAASHPPRTAWDHYTLGRSLLRAGNLEEAADHFNRAVEIQPQGFWPNYHQGVCAYKRGNAGDAAEAFRVCIALAPDKAACYYNRALAYQALNQLDRAAHDYDRALALDPSLGPASFNRAIIAHRAKQYPEALAGFRQAMANGIDPALVHYHLALVYHAKKERGPALDHVEQAIRQRPRYKEAEELREAIRREK